MRAIALRSGQIHVRDDVPDPQPGFGQDPRAGEGLRDQGGKTGGRPPRK